MYMCPYYDPDRRKCKLWDTYQSDYQIRTYCCSDYMGYFRKCANYEEKMR